MGLFTKFKNRIIPPLRDTSRTPYSILQNKNKITQLSRKELLGLYYQALNNVYVARCCQAYIDTTLSCGYTIDTDTMENDNVHTTNYVQRIFEKPEGLKGTIDYAGLISLIWKSFLVLGDCFIEVSYTKEGVWNGLRYVPTEKVYYNWDNDCYGLINTNILYEPHQLIHIYKPSIKANHSKFGTSLIDSCGSYIAMLNNAISYNNNTLKNRGINPASILNFDKDISTTDFNMQMERIDALRKETEEGGLLALKGASFISGANTNKDMAYMELMKFARDNILTTFGVPPQKAGVIETANLGSGSGQSQDKDWKQTFEGQSKYITNAFNEHIKRAGFNERFSFNEVDVQDKLLNAQIDEIYLRSGVYTVDEVRNKLGLDKTREITWSNYYGG